MFFSPAIYSGLCASFASMFGKLSGLEFEYLDVKFKYTVKGICFLLMIVLNSMVWTLFVRALQQSKTSFEATAVSSATNYILSGILGYLVFGESTSFFWWLGITLIVMGILLINTSPSNIKSEKHKS